MSLARTISEMVSNGTANDRFAGVVIGVVCDVADPQKQGRLKVTFPALSEQPSEWARVCSPLAGPGRGVFFLPKVNDEVLVVFEQGSMARPIIVGGLWNGQDKPPVSDAEYGSVTRIRMKCGHEVTLDEGSGGKPGRVEVRTAAGHRLTLNDTDPGSLTMADSSGRNKLVIESSSGEVTLKASTKLALSAPMIEIRASGDMTVQGGAKLDLKGALVRIN